MSTTREDEDNNNTSTSSSLFIFKYVFTFSEIIHEKVKKEYSEIEKVTGSEGVPNSEHEEMHLNVSVYVSVSIVNLLRKNLVNVYFK